MKTINSLELATMLSRTHGEVLKMIKGTSGKRGAIKDLQVQGIQNIEDYFIKSNYKGKLLCYEVTEKGCKILANKIGHSKRNPELTKESFLANCANYFNELEQQQTERSKESTHTNNSPISVFDNKEFGKIRTLIINDEPWFVGKDIASALDYENQNRDIITHVDRDDRIMLDKTQYENGIEFDYKDLGQRGGWIINESGLYSLILSSKLPSAKKFKRWVTSEVLPQIRKNNSYNMNINSDSTFLDKLLDRVSDKLTKELLGQNSNK